MVERVEDGGPAFPVVTSLLQLEYRREPHRFTHDVTTVGGMSLRDAFAIGALPAITLSHPKDLARKAYAIADAMLAARSPSEPLNARTQGVEAGR